MLTQIKKIKGLGVFDNYGASPDLQAFSRYNIVYGENGSGKTTLSRLFACIEAGEHPEYPNLDFTVEGQSGQFTKGNKYGRKIRVFNSDYIEANIGSFDGPLRHILILGQENKTIADELKTEIIVRDARLKNIEDCISRITKIETEKAKLFSQIAKTIGEATSGSTLRSYRKPDAEAAFAKMTDLILQSEGELEIHRTTVRQVQMPVLGSLSVPEIRTEPSGKMLCVITLATGSAERVKRLTNRSAQSAVIERFAKNPDIAVWIEEGIQIHTSHSSEMCEFCDRPMPADRLKALANHFSVEDQKLKDEIDTERLSLSAVIDALNRFTLPDRLALYSEMRTEYERSVEQFKNAIASLKSQLESLNSALADKLALRTTIYEPGIMVDVGPFLAAFDGVRSIIKRHDNKCAIFDKEKKAARELIEAHYLLTIKDQVDEISAKANALRSEAELLRCGGNELEDERSLEALMQSIIEKQAKLSNAHEGGAELTAHLKQFLGRTDLRFEAEKDGYRVLRRGRPAKRLSEGEKTAIAFLYFLVQLKDKEFELTEGVVVIDDPISSLDASAIYQAFSFLKNETQTAKQLFILTHNFEFLKLLINWMKNIRAKDKTFMMVICAETDHGRSARLTELDKLLVEHATEYHYLFKVLYSFKSDGTILGSYHIPNIARKVLETFLDFYAPSNKSLYQKLEETNFDPYKKTAIYKFANDLSHFTGKSFDPALVSEAQKNATYLLEMIEAVAPAHFQGLKNLSQIS